MPLLLQLPSQFDVVKDLPIKGNPQRGIVKLHGLLPTGQVQDAQARVPQRRSTVDMQSLLIGSAVNQRLHHALQCKSPEGSGTLADDPGNATHNSASHPYQQAIWLPEKAPLMAGTTNNPHLAVGILP